jgi:phospholipase/lecithinase/hemolysin
VSTVNLDSTCKAILRGMLLACAAFPISVKAGDRSITTVFGDSSVEQGNLYALPGLERPGTPYFNKDGFSRDSNGPVWVEYLVPDMTPYLAADIRTPHVNYAFSGATSGHDNIATTIPSGLIEQVDAYANRLASGAAKPGPQDVFVLAAGTNDFLRDLGQRDLKLTSADVIGNVTASASRLATLGARTLIVEDVPNFLTAPAFNDIVSATERPALEKNLSTLLDSHRADQRVALAQVLVKAPADQQIAVLPLQKLFAHALSNASALGFSVVNRACYDETTGKLCSTDVNVQNSYLFFDNLHLSARGQALQALYYNALIDQLDGSANLVPGRIIGDARSLTDMITSSDRHMRDRNWLAGAPVTGFEMIIDGGISRRSDADAPGWRGGHSNQEELRFGIAHGDGSGWSSRFLVSRLTGTTRLSDSGSYKLTAWASSGSLEAKIGHVRLALSTGEMWGKISDGIRPIGVPLMQANYRARFTALYGDLSAGYVWASGKWQVVPALALYGDRVRLSSYAETGQTGLEMAFRKSSDTAVRGGAELMISHAGWTTGQLTLRPRLKAEYQRRLNGAHSLITGTLIDNVARPITSSVRTSAMGHPVITPSLTIDVGPSLQIDLTGRQSIGARDRAATAQLTYRF